MNSSEFELDSSNKLPFQNIISKPKFRYQCFKLFCDRYVCFNFYQERLMIIFLTVDRGFVPHFRFCELKFKYSDEVDFKRIKKILKSKNQRILEASNSQSFYQDLAKNMLTKKYNSVEIKRKWTR